MKSNDFFHSPSARRSALALACAAVVAGFAGCGGGDDPVGPTTLQIVNAGNSPFVGVTVTATCANGTTASTTVGTVYAPGTGTLSLPDSCLLPVVVKATSDGKMRPIGANYDGSGDAPYRLGVHLPISATFDTVRSPRMTVTLNPVSTLVGALANRTGRTVAESQRFVETALGLSAGDAAHDLSDPDVAEASARIAWMSALAAQRLVSGSTNLQGKTVGQFLLDAWTDYLMNPMPALGNADQIAQALRSRVDVTSSADVALIQKASVRLYNTLVQSFNLDGHTTELEDVPASLNEASNELYIQYQGAQQHLYTVSKMRAKTDFVHAVQADPASLAAEQLKLDGAESVLNDMIDGAAVVRLVTTTTSTNPTESTSSSTSTSTSSTSSSSTSTSTSTSTSSSSTSTSTSTSTSSTSSSSTSTSTSTSSTSTTSTSTTTSTTTTTTQPPTFVACKVSYLGGVGYVTGVPAASGCLPTVVNIDGRPAGAVVTMETSVPTDALKVVFADAPVCDPWVVLPPSQSGKLAVCRVQSAP